MSTAKFVFGIYYLKTKTVHDSDINEAQTQTQMNSNLKRFKKSLVRVSSSN